MVFFFTPLPKNLILGKAFNKCLVINDCSACFTKILRTFLVISSVFAGGVLFGILGIIISLPLAIFLITTIKFYKADIYEIIEDIKEEKKANE